MLEGDDPYMFGRVSSIWATDERIYVVDSQAPALRMYDHTGRHLGDLGREGQGPGEYEVAGTVVVLPDGTVVLQDTRSDRITYFDTRGALLGTWSPESRFVSGMFMLADGTLLVRRADPPDEEQHSTFVDLTYGLAKVLPDGMLGAPRYPPKLGDETEEIMVEANEGTMVPHRAAQRYIAVASRVV